MLNMDFTGIMPFIEKVCCELSGEADVIRIRIIGTVPAIRGQAGQNRQTRWRRLDFIVMIIMIITIKTKVFEIITLHKYYMHPKQN